MIRQRILTLAHRIGLRRPPAPDTYPGLALGGGVNLGISGRFRYGPGCSISDRSVVAVGPRGSLTFGESVWCGTDVELGPSDAYMRIGNDTSVQNRCIFLGQIYVGDHCLFAPNVYMSSGRHCFDVQPELLIRDQDRAARERMLNGEIFHRPIRIEDDCWIGINSVIMAGVTIGRGCVIGANSVVTKDVAPYSIVAGAPARVLRPRLVFAPPAMIEHGRQEHLPYFYRGFGLLERDRKRHGDGVAARREFAVWLSPSPVPAQVHLRIRLMDQSSASGATAQLLCGQQSAVLNGKFSHCVFQVSDATRPIEFCIRTSASAPADGFIALVERAWIEPAPGAT